MALMLVDLALFLVAKGYGVYDPTGATSSIFVGTIPDAPDTLIALEEYAGIAAPSAWTLDGATLPQWETPRVHVTVRGAPFDYNSPRLTIERIYQLFLATTDTGLTATHYFRLSPIGSGIFAMPVNSDANGRRLLVANFECMKELSPTT